MNYGETVGNSAMIHDSIRVTSVRNKVSAPSLTEVGIQSVKQQRGAYSHVKGRLERLNRSDSLNNSC